MRGIPSPMTASGGRPHVQHRRAERVTSVHRRGPIGYVVDRDAGVGRRAGRGCGGRGSVVWAQPSMPGGPGRGAGGGSPAAPGRVRTGFSVPGAAAAGSGRADHHGARAVQGIPCWTCSGPHPSPPGVRRAAGCADRPLSLEWASAASCWRIPVSGGGGELLGGGLAFGNETGCIASTPDLRPGHDAWEGQVI